MRIFKYYFVISYKFKLAQINVEKPHVHQIFHLDPKCGHCLGPCLNGDSSVQTYQEHVGKGAWTELSICMHVDKQVHSVCICMSMYTS